MAYAVQQKQGEELNRLYTEDLPVHEWYRFVLSYPPHLVRDYLEKFGIGEQQRVLDPFCGTGTTLVECKKNRISSVGLEANPIVHYAASMKVDWQVDPIGLVNHAEAVARHALESIKANPYSSPLLLRQLTEEQSKLIITDSISPKPLHKVLLLLESLEALRNAAFHNHERVALAKQIVYSISNLRFGPEVGVSRVKKDDPDVIEPWLSGVHLMANDLEIVRDRKDVESHVYLCDSRSINDEIEAESIDAVITSPPYPNEKDYTRATRLESVLLGFMNDRKDLRRYKQGLIRSNTRNVYKGDTDEEWVVNNEVVQELAERIEARRIELDKTSGFEKLYYKVVKLYFGGMARHLEELKRVLKPGAKLAYVVGDQASFFRVMIRTGAVLADVAKRQGYEVEGINLFRTRFSTATQYQLREEVVVLRWMGNS